MRKDPPMNKFPNRQSLRLKNYDYSQPGSYFITICTQNRIHRFGEIDNGKMELNEYGKIVKKQWYAIPQQFTNIGIDEFVVMPDHIHGIITIDGISNNRTTARVARTYPMGNMVSPTVGDVVGAFKSLSVHFCLQWIEKNDSSIRLGKLWQRNYWEHIIRNKAALNRIRKYIRNNPVKWEINKLKSTQGDIVTKLRV